MPIVCHKWALVPTGDRTRVLISGRRCLRPVISLYLFVGHRLSLRRGLAFRLPHYEAQAFVVAVVS